MTDSSALLDRLDALAALADPGVDAPDTGILYAISDQAITPIDLVAPLWRRHLTPVEVCHTLRLLIAGTGWTPTPANGDLYRVSAVACYTRHGAVRAVVAVDTEGLIHTVGRAHDQSAVTPQPSRELTSALDALLAAWRHADITHTPARCSRGHDRPRFDELHALLATAPVPESISERIWQRCAVEAIRLHAIQVTEPATTDLRVGLGRRVRDLIRADVTDGTLDVAYANHILDRLGLPALALTYTVQLQMPITVDVTAAHRDDVEAAAITALHDPDTDLTWDWNDATVVSIVDHTVYADDNDDTEVDW
jgi:hypothetical protein